MMETTTKKCVNCGKPVKGRSDKKFCDDYCRNAYNNQANGIHNAMIRSINNDLRKNRQILLSLLPDGSETVKLPKSKLLDMGFKFKWITHQYKNAKGQVYHYCYDYGYLFIEDDLLLVVKQKE